MPKRAKVNIEIYKKDQAVLDELLANKELKTHADAFAFIVKVCNNLIEDNKNLRADRNTKLASSNPDIYR